MAMALNVGNTVLLAIGAILLVTGAVRTAVYLVPPGPNQVYQWGLGFPQGTVAQQAETINAPTLVPLQSSAANTVAALTDTPPAQAAPEAASPEFPTSIAPRSIAPQRMADQEGNAGSPAPEPEIAGAAVPVPITDAMEPLGDKFLRVWHWVQETGEFIYYDPLVPEESTLKAVASGQTYLILVTESVTLIVNGQQLELSCDDGDCWNRVVWP